MKIKQAIIPAAGLGTRFLPTTKVGAKELLPLYDKPCLIHILEEGVSAGIEEFIIIISDRKQVIKDFFSNDDDLNNFLATRGQDELLKPFSELLKKISLKFVVQENPLGLGHAVLCAESYITDENFLVMLPDDIIISDIPVAKQMIDVFQIHQKPLLAVMEVTWEEVSRYGIVSAHPLTEKIGEIQSVVEKPKREVAPSNLAVIGRYLLPKEIFCDLKNLSPSVGGEIQLTDAVARIVDKKGLGSYLFDGERFDAGTPLGLVKSSVAVALNHPESRESMKSFIKLLQMSL